MATYNANISVKVTGLTTLKNLEDRVSELQKRFTKVNAAAANITAPFQGHIKALKEVNTLLKANNDLLNRQYQMATSMARSRGGGGGGGGSGRDAALQKEISDQLSRQVELLRERARAVAPAGDAMQKLLRAQAELNSGAEANVKMVRQWIRSARDLVNEEERRARAVQSAAAEELRTKQYIWRQQAKALRDQEAAEIKLSALRVREAERASRASARSAGGGGGGGGGGGVGGAFGRVDRAFGGGGSSLINGVIDSGIRAAAVGTVLAGSQFVNAAQNIWGIGDALKSMTGPLAEAIHMLGDFTGEWGLAAVAAAAFAPWLPKIGQAAIQGLQGVGSLGKAIADVTGLTERAQPAIAGLKKSWDTLASSGPVPALFGLGSNSMTLTGGQAPQLMNGADKFQSSMGLEMVKRLADGIYQQIQASADAMEANRRKAQGWADALKQGKEWIEESVAATRSLEQSRSIAARERLAAAAANNPVVTASRRPGTFQYDRELMPGGNSMTAQPQYRARLNAQSRLTDETRYSWVRALREGNQILKDNAALDAKELAAGEKAVAQKREKLLIASREVDFENRLGRVMEKNAATAQKTEAVRQRNYGIRTGIGAGLSLANIPGQAIAQATSIGAAVGGKTGGLAGFVTGSTVALAQFLVTATQTGIEAESLQQRLKLLSDGFDSYGKVAETTAALASKFGMSQNEAAQAFGNAYARLRPMGASLDEIKTIFEGFNTAVKLSGSSTAEAQGAYVQLVQALGAGALRGQELNSILEQAPLLALAIAKEMNTTVGSLKKFGEEGKISSAIVLKALARVRDEGAGRLAKALDTPQQKVKDFQNAWERFQVALTRHIIPAVTKALGGLATLINNISNAIDTLAAKGMAGDLNRRTSYGTAKGKAGNVPGQLDDYSAILGELQRVPQRNRAGAVVQLGVARDISTRLRGIRATGISEVDARLVQLQEAAMGLITTIEERIQQIDKAVAKPGTLAGQVPPAGAGGGKGDKAVEEAVRRGVIGGLTGGGQGDASRGRSSGPHLHAQGSGNLQALVDQALDFGGGRTASSFGISRGAAGHGYNAIDYLTPQGTPFTLRPGYTAKDLGIRGALGRGMEISGPGGSFQLGHLSGVRMGDLTGKGAAGDLLDAQQDALNAAVEAEAELAQKRAESLKAGRALTTELQRQLDGLNAVDDAAREQLRIQFEWQDRQEKINELLDEKQKKDLTALNNKIKEIELLKEQQKIIDDMQGGGYKNFSGGNIDTYTDAGQAIEESKKQLEDLTNPINQVVAGATAIGAAFGESFKGLVSGAMTAQEALRNFFEKTADHFLDMAAKIAAAAIQHAIISTIFRGATGAITGGGFGGGGIDWGQTPSVGGVPDLPGLTPLATGGLVTRPTPALLGEGGESEVVIPASKIPNAMANYRPGSGAAGLAQAMNAPEGGGGGGVTVNYTGPTLNFNGDDYLPKSAVPEIIRTAANRGAAGGHSRVMGDLRNKRSTRARLGMA